MIATINIRGKIIQTDFENISNLSVFNENINNGQNNFDLDMDPQIFEKILDCIRFNKNFPFRQYKDELEYIGIYEDNTIIEINEGINVNIGGTIIEVEKKILEKIEYFKNMFSNKWKNDGILFLDMSITAFNHILKYIKDTDYIIPIEYKEEADFLLISKKNKLIKYDLDNNCFDNDDNEINENNLNYDILSLKSISIKNEYYNKNPNVTYFKQRHQKCTNSKPAVHNFKIDNICQFEGEFEFTVPNLINFPSYFLIEISLDDILFTNSLDTTHKVKWINNLESHIFENIDVYQKDKYITSIHSEAVYIYKKIFHQKHSHQNMNTIIIPITNYYRDEHFIMYNYNSPIKMKIKMRPLYQLVRLLNNNVDITNNYDIKTCISGGNINNIIIHCKHYILDDDEKNRFNNLNYDQFVRFFKSQITNYQKDLILPLSNTTNNFSIKIPIKLNDLIDTIGIYIRKKENLYPLNDDFIEKIQFWADDIRIFNLKKHIAQKIFEVETSKTRTNYFSNDDVNCFDDGIFFVNLSVYEKRSTFIDLELYSEKYIIIDLNKNFNYDDKEIVIVFFGDMIIRKTGTDDSTNIESLYSQNHQ